MALIYDMADPQELQGFVREVQQERNTNRFILSQFLPTENIDEITWRANQGQLVDEDAAQVRAWDTESPIGNRQSIRRIMGELPPISQKYRLGEEERLRRRALERGSNQGIVDAIYDDAAKGARAVAARIELLRGEALETGALAIDENGVVQDVDYGRDSDHEVSPGIVWSTTASATPITDELEWTTVYSDTNGIEPGVALTGKAVVNNLLLNAQYRDFAAVRGITPAFLSLVQLNQVRTAYGLPPLFTYDVKIRVGGTQQRVISDNKVIYLPPSGEPLGRTFQGTTAEALEMADARAISTEGMPGMTCVVNKTDDPVAIWTNTSAIALPVLINPDLTLVATVQA